MAQGVGISKTERRQALSRVKKFLKEFKSKPEHSINFENWYQPISSVEVARLDKAKISHCGSIGCLGGYVTHSPLYKAYKQNLPKYSPFWYDAEYYFFGLTSTQADNLCLFCSRQSKKSTMDYSDKQEGIDRLKKVIKFHEKALLT